MFTLEHVDFQQTTEGFVVRQIANTEALDEVGLEVETFIRTDKNEAFRPVSGTEEHVDCLKAGRSKKALQISVDGEKVAVELLKSESYLEERFLVDGNVIVVPVDWNKDRVCQYSLLGARYTTDAKPGSGPEPMSWGSASGLYANKYWVPLSISSRDEKALLKALPVLSARNGLQNFVILPNSIDNYTPKIQHKPTEGRAPRYQ